jgi:hypothetical protein
VAVAAVSAVAVVIGGGRALLGDASAASAADGTVGAASASSSPRPLLTRPATGQFEVVDGRVFDPDGVQFVPVGTNMNGPGSFFGEPTDGKAGLLQDGWAFNLVRLVMCEPTGCEANHYVAPANDDLDAIVAEYTSRHIVVLLDYQQLDPGKQATADDIAGARAFWIDKAQRYRDNPYVWFNLYNEPESRVHDWQADLPWNAFQSRWWDQHVQVLAAVRQAGAQNMVVVDDAQTGQGTVGWFDIGNPSADDSAVISLGAQLVQADSAHRTMFSMHAYDFWGWPAPLGDMACTQRWSDAQRDARLRSYLQQVHDRGLALMIGELGFFPWEADASGTSFHLGAVDGVPPCGSPQRLAAAAVYRLAPEFDLGVLTWHGFDLTEAGAQNWDLWGSPPGNLTDLGRWQYDYAHAVAARPVDPDVLGPGGSSPGGSTGGDGSDAGGRGPGGETPTSPGAGYTPVVPERLLDTRPGPAQAGYHGERPDPAHPVALTVTGTGDARVPADAAAVVLNVTADGPQGDGYVTVWPCGTPRPLASNLNLRPATTTPNLVITKLGAGGQVCLYTSTPTHLVADLAGWYPTAPAG